MTCFHALNFHTCSPGSWIGEATIAQELIGRWTKADAQTYLRDLRFSQITFLSSTTHP